MKKINMNQCTEQQKISIYPVYNMACREGNTGISTAELHNKHSPHEQNRAEQSVQVLIADSTPYRPYCQGSGLRRAWGEAGKELSCLPAEQQRALRSGRPEERGSSATENAEEFEAKGPKTLGGMRFSTWA